MHKSLLLISRYIIIIATVSTQSTLSAMQPDDDNDWEDLGNIAADEGDLTTSPKQSSYAKPFDKLRTEGVVSGHGEEQTLSASRTTDDRLNADNDLKQPLLEHRSDSPSLIYTSKPTTPKSNTCVNPEYISITINAEVKDHKTPSMQEKQGNSAELIIDIKELENSLNTGQTRELFKAIENHNIGEVKKIIQLIKDPNEQIEGQSALGLAVNLANQSESNHKLYLPIIATILKHQNINVNVMERFTLIDHLTICRCRIYTTRKVFHAPPHIAAIAAENWPLAQLLLEHKTADIKARDQHGKTALHWAAHWTNPLAIQLLVDKGASIDALDNQQQLPCNYYNTDRDQTGEIESLITPKNRQLKSKSYCSCCCIQ